MTAVWHCHDWVQIGLMTFGSILAFVLQRRSSPTTFDISPGGYAILAILLVNSNIRTLPVQLNIKLASVSKLEKNRNLTVKNKINR